MKTSNGQTVAPFPNETFCHGRRRGPLEVRELRETSYGQTVAPFPNKTFGHGRRWGQIRLEKLNR